MRLQTYLVFLVLATAAGCSGPKKATLDDLYSRPVRMPDGTVYTAEVVTKAFDMTRGLMFRDKLEADRGMLFVYNAAGNYPVWTYQTRIAIDTIWMDPNRLITEIVPNIEPCKSESARQCPQYGGKTRAMYVLEVNAGVAARHNLKPGDRLHF